MFKCGAIAGAILLAVVAFSVASSAAPAFEPVQITTKEKIAVFDPKNPRQPLGAFEPGTTLTVVEPVPDAGMYRVKYTNSKGGVIEALCKAEAIDSALVGQRDPLPSNQTASEPLVLQSPARKDFKASMGMEMAWVPWEEMKEGGLWVGKYEVTQTEYKKVTGANPSAFAKGGARRPVENVSWDDAMEFCKKLTEIERKAGRLPEGNWQYSLPTEKQWDYYVADTDLKDAVYGRDSNKGGMTAEVGSKKPNKLGLYDVRGNVWEWCLEPHDGDPTKRVCRGAGWFATSPEDFGLGYRINLTPPSRFSNLGFRCVVVGTSSP